MKKIIASAIGLALVGGVAVTASAEVESQFGGYWRTRLIYQDNMKGTDASYGVAADNDTGSYSRVDNRTRLYYTAKFNDSFKFVNKFEFNSNWGDANGGDIGADGDTFKVKNSYADFTLGNVQTKLGIQGASIGRDFIFSDDFSGAYVNMKFGMVEVPLMWIRPDSVDGGGKENDRDYLVAQARIKINDTFKVQPYFLYDVKSDLDFDQEWENWYLGLDVDMKMDALSAWGTFIYNGGSIQTDIYNDNDNKGYLLAAGVDAGIAHGQVFYATGDEDGALGEDAFKLPQGASYYWSEIMGLGTFDNTASNGAPGDQISNIMAINAGVTLKPMDKMTLKGDIWYAMLAEDDAAGNDKLGTELDAKLTYALMDNLNLDLVLAYLFADDATGGEDVLETGARFSLSF